MSKPLEPTEEQVRAAAAALLHRPAGDPHLMVRDAWAVIAPMVLEEVRDWVERRRQEAFEVGEPHDASLLTDLKVRLGDGSWLSEREVLKRGPRF